MWFLWTILTLLALTGIVLLAGAVFARFVLQPPGPPLLELIGPDDRLAPEVTAALAGFESALKQAGLTPLGRVRTRNAPAVSAYAVGLRTDDGLAIGQGIVHTVMLGGRERIVSRCVELSSRLEGGPVLVTSNASRHALTDRLVSYWRFPLCRDPAALLRIHRAIMEADSRKPVPLGAEPNAWLSRLNEDGEQTWRALSDAGLVRRSAGGANARVRRGTGAGWRYTWRFALATMPGSLWPVSALRERSDRREAKALLETVWLGGLWRTG